MKETTKVCLVEVKSKNCQYKRYLTNLNTLHHLISHCCKRIKVRGEENLAQQRSYNTWAMPRLKRQYQNKFNCTVRGYFGV